MKMELFLRKRKINNKWKFREIVGADAGALGELMLEAYRGTIDYEGETLRDAISEVNETIEGKYGLFLPKCSFLIEEDQKAVSATMVTLPEKASTPLLAFSMTSPNFKRRHMATFLLQMTINALIEEGYTKLNLVVTEGNEPAEKMYKKLGFRIVI